LARRKAETGEATSSAKHVGKPRGRLGRAKRAKAKLQTGRPERLAVLSTDGPRDRSAISGATARLQQPGNLAGNDPQSAKADRFPGNFAAGEAADILCLPNPDWLPHILAITGAPAELEAFQRAATGPGVIPWQRDYSRLEEDWLHRLLAASPAERALSVYAARIAARELRDALEALEMRAADRPERNACPLDLNVLVPVPFKLLALEPDDPAVLGWLWAHWGTTWMLREIEIVTSASGTDVRAVAGHDVLRFRFFAADWTPWRALETIRVNWPALSFTLKSDTVG
jgi:hypothetical protein